MKLASIFLVFLWCTCLWAPSFGQDKVKKVSPEKEKEAEGLFFDASRLDILEKHTEALTLYLKSLEINPENAAACFKVADLYLKQNKPSEALPYAKRATESQKDNAYYWVQLASIQELLQDWEAATSTYEELAKRFEEGKKYRLNIVQLNIRNKKYKKAIQELERIEKEMGPSPEVFSTRMQLYQMEKKWDKAEKEAREWLEVFPEDPASRLNLAQFLIDQKKYPEAKKQLLDLLSIGGSNASAHLLLANLYLLENDEKNADLQLEKALQNPDLPVGAKMDLVGGFLRGSLSKEEEEKALRFIDLILQTDPENAQVLIMKGDLLNKFGRKQEARIYFIRAKKQNKNNFALWEQLVLIDLNLNDLDSVEIHTAEAKNLFPNTALFSFYNGLSNLMLKKYDKAIESLQQAKRLSLDNREMQLEIHSQLGDAYYNVKESEKAFAAFDQVLKLDSANPHVLNNYSYFLSLEKNRLEKALKMSYKLIQLHPEDPTFLDTHGWVLYQKGNYAEALPVLEKAAKNSNSGTIWEHYGDALFQNGKNEQAMEAWKKAKELGGETSQQLQNKLRDKKIQ